VKYAVLVQVSDELVNDAAFDIASMISEAAGQEMAIAHGAAASTAVVTAAGTGGTAAGTVVYTYAELVALQYSVKQQYRNAAKSGFLMSDASPWSDPWHDFIVAAFVPARRTGWR
jgi:HK97 family phage major capsid protein